MRQWMKILAFTCAFCLAANGAQAALPYEGYTYDAWGKCVAAPVSYQLEAVYSGYGLSGKHLKTPGDLFVSPGGQVYISDTGNKRILVCDGEMRLLREITGYTGFSGEQLSLTEPQGLFVDSEDNLYIALPKEEKVIRLNASLCLEKEFTRPDSDLLKENAIFSPSAVLVNQRGTVFVLVSGLYLGAIVYSPQGNFLGFYGADDVVVTPALLASRMWKRIMSQEQSDKLERFVPIEFNSFDIDQDNFVYTCTSQSNSSKREISKLNTLGNDVFVRAKQNVEAFTGDYGDLEIARYQGQRIDNQFVDLAVREDGLIFALDKTQGRVFEYDQESRLLAVFGLNAYQQGGFQRAKAIDTLGNRVLVLDDQKCTVTVFSATQYGQDVENAMLLYRDGRYQEARMLWEKVLDQNGNCTYAYAGIGKALYEEGRYEEAMAYFRYAYDREAYSRAYKEYRVEQAAKYLPYGLYGAFFMTIAAIVIRKWKKWAGRKDG